MSLKNFFDSFDDTCTPHHRVGFNWSSKGCGFGQMYFHFDKSDGYVHCDNETMGREFLKEMLCKMVDNCVLDSPSRRDDTDGKPPGYSPKPYVEPVDDTDSPQG